MIGTFRRKTASDAVTPSMAILHSVNAIGEKGVAGGGDPLDKFRGAGPWSRVRTALACLRPVADNELSDGPASLDACVRPTQSLSIDRRKRLGQCAPDAAGIGEGADLL
jgi:hypothetical protein